jgi:hypothetical protein
LKITNVVIPRDGCKRYLRTITDDPTADEAHKVQRKFEFLISVVQDGIYSGILNCGPYAFEKLNMEHDGRSWVIKLEAEVFE